MGDLVNVDQFIDHNHHARITGQPEESREQLQIVVPVVIRNHHIDAQFISCFAFQRVFPAEPSDDFGFRPVISVHIGAVIGGEQLCKFKTMHEFAD